MLLKIFCWSIYYYTIGIIIIYPILIACNIARSNIIRNSRDAEDVALRSTPFYTS